ncbi:MAG TPA: OmpA family protein [Puia sp.]|nr:OmpA family protein [Puia sp.]
MASAATRIRSKMLLLVCLLICHSLGARCQTLLANGGFEDVNTCTEYHAQCAPAAWFTVSPPEFAWPTAKEGEQTMSFVYDNVYTPMAKRSFPYTMTLCPLKAGKEYEVSFWLYTDKFPFTHLEIMLSAADPARAPRVIGKTPPSVSLSKADIVEKDDYGWMLFRKKFRVEEEKNFFMVGNMLLPEPFPRGLDKKLGKAYGNIVFWMDDIDLYPTDTAERLCPWSGYNQSVLYQEHHRHTKHIYLDSLPANSVPLETSHDTLVAQQSTPPLFVMPPIDTLLVPGIFFATNSSIIKRNYARLLDTLISRIGSKKPVRIEIAGHTDNTATDAFNQGLSLRRAAGIRDYILLHQPGLTSITSIQGYGSSRPVATNVTPAGKARNRRVEIVIIY